MLKTSFEFIDLDNITEQELMDVLDKNKQHAINIKLKTKQLEEIAKKTKQEKYIKTQSEEIHLTNDSEEETEEYSFEDEVDFYLNSLGSVTIEMEDEEIIRLLPSKKNSNYQNLLFRLKLEAIKSLESIHDLLLELPSLKESEAEYLKQEKLIERRKINAIDQVLTNDNTKEEEIKNKLVFVPTSGGNIRILEELQNISKEHYPSFLELIESIKNNTFKNVKRFSRVDKKMSGISEVRDISTGARVIFDRIGLDTYAIITSFMKKTSHNKGYQNQLTNKTLNYKNMLPAIKENLDNAEFMGQQQEYETELYNTLQNHKTTSTGGIKCKTK